MKSKSAKSTAELVSITVKINGKKRIFKKESLHFRGWEADCDICGSHSGVDLEIFEENKMHKIKTHKIALESN